ncbi:10913223-c865-4b09-9304-f89bd8a4cb13 [Thermothielavioides terrestris]|uniref:10913223-c865-4b09-9304-f89bd8a4cb13 n=1 Tax=Thermothielavioides terrestris TaxID=2587410 RepID=A0A3S4AL80_9PEZI|nr:10913223-c865-4b09-9304-f89bd8a4cb13 [Thermothielavioides terrestris]
MSDSAKRRVQAIGNQLADSSIPAVFKVAPSGPRVAGKVVIITGANSILGIGRASAHQFAEHGARAIYMCDYDGSHLEAHKREINALWPQVDVHTRQFDAADEKAVKEVVDDAVKRYGRLDVFFANAGITGPHTLFTQMEADDFMETLRVNTLSVFLAAKHAAPAMQITSAAKPSPSGSIIATASVAGLRSNAGSSAYSASKAAVISLAQTAAFQLAGTGVRVNALCPGLIETGMTAPVFDTARARGTQGRIGQLNPLKRAGHADEIARVALFLVSDESSYVNGQAWAVDGGLSAGLPYVLGKMA